MAELFDPLSNHRKQLERDITIWQAKLEEIQSDATFLEPYKALATSHLRKRIVLMKTALGMFKP
jgi:hypothetical protein